MKQKCKDCGKDLTELFTSVVCDWCDGIEEEWDYDKDQITDPLYPFDWANPISFNFLKNYDPFDFED